MQIDLLKGSLLCTLEHGEMHYMIGREDWDAPRFCRHVIFKVMLCAMPIYVIRHHWLVLKFWFIVVKEKAILSARMAKIRIIYQNFGDRRWRIRLFFGDNVISEGKCSLAVSIIWFHIYSINTICKVLSFRLLRKLRAVTRIQARNATFRSILVLVFTAS